MKTSRQAAKEPSRRRGTPLLLSLSACLLGICPAVARGDGGTVRLSERQGGYRITVFTAPTPFRAGPVDISVLVQDALTGEPLPQAQVAVQASPQGQGTRAIRSAATTEAATNKLLHAALFELPEPGWWEMEVTIEGPRGSVQVGFTLAAADPPPRWLALWPWIGWPALAIVLFALHQRLVRRKRPGAPTLC